MKRSELRKIIEDYCPLRKDDDEPCKTERIVHCVYCESLIDKLIESGIGTSKPLVIPENPYPDQHMGYRYFLQGAQTTRHMNQSGAFQPIEKDTEVKEEK